MSQHVIQDHFIREKELVIGGPQFIRDVRAKQVTHGTMYSYDYSTFPAAPSKAAHWKWHCDHYLPRAWMWAVFTSLYTLTLSTHLCCHKSWEICHRRYQVQVWTNTLQLIHGYWNHFWACHGYLSGYSVILEARGQQSSHHAITYIYTCTSPTKNTSTSYARTQGWITIIVLIPIFHAGTMLQA